MRITLSIAIIVGVDETSVKVRPKYEESPSALLPECKQIIRNVCPRGVLTRRRLASLLVDQPGGRRPSQASLLL